MYCSKSINRIFPVVSLTLLTILFHDTAFSKGVSISNELVLSDQRDVYSPGQYIDYLEDTHGTWSINDICNDPLKTIFTRNNTENINFLNRNLANFVPIIKKNNGFIDKYFGDAIMALFPKGVNAAVEMQKKVEEVNKTGNTSGIGSAHVVKPSILAEY